MAVTSRRGGASSSPIGCNWQGRNKEARPAHTVTQFVVLAHKKRKFVQLQQEKCVNFIKDCDASFGQL